MQIGIAMPASCKICYSYKKHFWKEEKKLKGWHCTSLSKEKKKKKATPTVCTYVYLFLKQKSYAIFPSLALWEYAFSETKR